MTVLTNEGRELIELTSDNTEKVTQLIAFYKSMGMPMDSLEGIINWAIQILYNIETSPISEGDLD